MFVSIMYSICRSPCILCYSVIRKYSVKSVGKKTKYNLRPVSDKQSVNVIKKYNAENKALFGKLVETAAQKRSRDAIKIVSGDENALNISEEKNLSSEIWWWRYCSKAKVIRKDDNETKSSYVMKENIQHCPGPGGTSVHEDSQKLKDSNVNNSLSDHRPDLPKNHLKLPNIIVRNLTTFPLENCSKDISNESQDIINICTKKSSISQVPDLYYPSVSRILNATISEASRAALQRWKEGLIKDLGEEGFLKHQKELLDNGKLFHSSIQTFLAGTPRSELTVDPQIEGCWHSMKSVLPNICDVKVLESHVMHKDLFYHGIIDCVAFYEGKPLLIEWKKSDKQKPMLGKTYDAPVQVAAYFGALNFDANYDFKVAGGMVVVAYTDGTPAHTHKMSLADCHKYWKMWLERLQLYWKMVEKQDMEKKLHAIA